MLNSIASAKDFVILTRSERADQAVFSSQLKRTFLSAWAIKGYLDEVVMNKGIALTMTQQFEMERINRAIDSTADPEQLQTIAKQLLQAWQSQRAATDWVIRQQMEGL